MAVVEQGIALACERIDKDVGPSVVIVVGEVGTHSRKGSAVGIVSRAQVHGHLLERTVLSIVKELLRERVVGDQDIRPAVAIVVVHRNAQTLAWKPRHACLGGAALENPPAPLWKYQRCHGLELVRMAVCPIAGAALSAPDIPAEVPFEVPCDDQIQ